MKKLTIDIFLNERWYGSLRVNNPGGSLIPITEEEIKEEVEHRLPLLKGKRYNIALS